MATIDLTSAEAVKDFYQNRFLPSLDEEGSRQWPEDYVTILDAVQNASSEQLATTKLQTLIWEGTNITGPGMCSISMQPAIESTKLSTWTAGLVDDVNRFNGKERIQRLSDIYDELVTRTQELTTRTPWLKILRLLAALFPEDFCCLVDRQKLRQLAKAMLGRIPRGESDVVWLNAAIYSQLDKFLGPADDDTESIVRRSIFTWDLYLACLPEEQEPGGEEEGPRPGESTLDFLPQERRRKGLSAFAGTISTCFQVLDFVQNGATEAETIDFLKGEFPEHKDKNLMMILGNIRHQLGLLARDGNTLLPSPLGQKLIDTDDPAILIPRVLTRVIGYDLILYLLKQHETLDRQTLITALKEHYPRWNADFAPAVQLTWAVALKMIRYDESSYSLTEVGAEYAELITEKPTPFVFDEPIEPGPVGPFNKPTLAEILTKFEELPFVFPPEIVAQLHIALHMHPSKHFVLLSGLSGTGKTKLAELYANAYHKVDKTRDNPFFCLIPVQPDWTDPTGLLGYINPLRETPTYASTEFLNFLQSAVLKPDVPHFVCLDEMNLARVEYYFAPFLSAMETAQDIVIHQNDEPVDTIEPRLPWPNNLYIIGTVNMDETTHAFSDKVLDRAFTIEFWDVDLDKFAEEFSKGHPKYPKGILKDTMATLGRLKEILEPSHQHFGYRTAEEVLLFLLTNHTEGNKILDSNTALDNAVLMKILPKIRGQDSIEFRTSLTNLQAFLEEKELTASARKTASMCQELELTGTTKFWR